MCLRAAATTATVTEPSGFRSGRKFAARLGLVPRDRCRSSGRECRRCAGWRGDYSHLPTDQIRRQFRKPRILFSRPAEFDRMFWPSTRPASPSPLRNAATI